LNNITAINFYQAIIGHCRLCVVAAINTAA
jgi:hypothetical protein